MSVGIGKSPPPDHKKSRLGRQPRLQHQPPTETLIALQFRVLKFRGQRIANPRVGSSAAYGATTLTQLRRPSGLAGFSLRVEFAPLATAVHRAMKFASKGEGLSLLQARASCSGMFKSITGKTTTVSG